MIGPVISSNMLILACRYAEVHAMSMCVALRFGHLPPLKLVPRIDVYNKVDAISLEQVDKLARQPNTVVISCEMDLKLVNVFYGGSLGH